VGVTYDITGDGKTVARGSYSMYFGQMAPGQLSSVLAATGQVQVRYPWSDLNGDAFVQPNEINFNTLLARSAAYDPNNPSNFRSPATVDPNIKNDRTREFIVGIDREIMNNLGVGVAYIWRKYDQFSWNDNVNFTSADYVQRTLTPTCTVAGARCETVTYFEPTIPIPAAYVLTNQPDRYRSFNGFEFTLRKRYADRWQASFSYAYNDATDHWDSPNAFQDPTNIEFQDNAQYAPESGGSGIDNIFTNAKWLVKASGQYTLPWYDVGVAGFVNFRQGYPFPQSILSPNRANQGGQIQILLDPLGDVRLPNVYTADFRVDKRFTFNRFSIVPSMDVFNITNVNTELARRRNQAATNANFISGIVAPRVIRFGFRAEW
jgi:hypothetical protein